MEQKGRCTHMTDRPLQGIRRPHPCPHPLCIISTGNLCPGNRKSAGHDTVCHLSSTPHLKTSPPCQQPQRGKVHLLCPRRRSYLYHFPAGFGTYCRITSPSTPMDLCDSLKKSFLLSMENHLHFTRESAIIRAYRISPV